MDVRDIGERVYWLRDERGWTQEELAGKAGLSPTTVSHIESGTIERPRVNTMRRLARAFGVRTEELTNPKAPVPSGPPSEETGGAEDELKKRLDLLHDYETSLQDVAGKLRRDFEALRIARDSKALSTLHVTVVLTAVGADKSIEEDEEIEEREDESVEELEARYAMVQASEGLTALAEEIEGEMEAFGERPVTYLADRLRRKAG